MVTEPRTEAGRDMLLSSERGYEMLARILRIESEAAAGPRYEARLRRIEAAARLLCLRLSNDPLLRLGEETRQAWRDLYDAALEAEAAAGPRDEGLTWETLATVVSDSLAATTEGTDWAEAPEPSDEPGSPYVKRLTNEMWMRLGQHVGFLAKASE